MHTRLSEEIIYEVFNGDFDNFHLFLKNEKVTALDLGRLDKHPLYKPFENIENAAIKRRLLLNFGIALKGTAVSDVSFYFGGLEAEHALAFCQSLSETNICSLHFSSNNLELPGAIAIVCSLKKTKVAVLNLSSTITCSGYWHEVANSLIALAKALNETNVKVLYLNDNNLLPKGINIFLSALNTNLLETIHLSGNLIRGNAGSICKILNELGLKRIDISNNLLEDDDLKDVIIALENSTITTVISKNNSAKIEDTFNELPRTRIRHLDISNSELDINTIHALVSIIPLTQLTDLYLNQRFVPQGVQELINQALAANRQKIHAAYQTALLARLLNAQQKPFYGRQELSTAGTTKQQSMSAIRCAGEILMNVPFDLHSHILQYLPLMNAKRAQRFLNIASKRKLTYVDPAVASPKLSKG
jgi:hypothetical protein